MIEIDERKILNPTLPVSIASIATTPSTSANLNNVATNDDFPEKKEYLKIHNITPIK